MQFIFGKIDFVFQLTYWIASLLIWWGYYDREYESVDFSFLIMLSATLIFNSASVAAKYATFTREYRKRLLNRYVSQREMDRWMILGEWKKQSEITIVREIEHSVRRKFIDPSTFKCAFLEDPSKEIEQLLVKPETEVKKWVSNNCVYVGTEGGEKIEYYDCRLILMSLIQLHTKKYSFDYITPVALVSALIWFIIPPGTRLLLGLSIGGINLIEGFIYFFSCAVFSMTFFFSFLRFRAAYMDYNRISFLLDQLTQMYSPVKLPGIKHKVFPTINLADPVSLQSWLNMRKMAFDYGINFHNRHKIAIPFILGIATVSYLYLVSYGILFPNFTKNHITRIQFVLAFLAISYGWMFIVLVRISQRVNNHYKEHLIILRDNQQLFQSLHHFRDYYVPENVKDKEIPFEVKKVFNTYTRSIPHREITLYIKEALGKQYAEFGDPLVEKLVEMQNEFAKEIERQERFHSKTFLGFRINFAITGFVTIGYLVCLGYGYILGFQKRLPLIED